MMIMNSEVSDELTVLTRKSMDQLPDEIWSLIIGFCVPIFKLVVFQPRQQTNKIRVHGLPCLSNVKLVNKLFYNEVWISIRRKFSGRLDLDNLGSVYDEAVLVDYLNKSLATRLSNLAPRVKEIYYTGDYLEMVDDLRFELLPALKTLYFEPKQAAQHQSLLAGTTLNDALAGRADHEVLPCVLKTFQYDEIGQLLVSSMRKNGTEVVFQYLFDLSDDEIGVFYVDCTDPERLRVRHRASWWAESDDDEVDSH